MHQLDQLISELAGYYPHADLPLVRRAYQFAAVAQIIAELKLDVASVCAGLLHDCVEDTSATVEQLGDIFGKEIAFLVDGVTKLGKLPYSTREEQQAENFRKMLLAMARDIRVILVKLCDRLDNMRSLNHLPPEKQERIAARRCRSTPHSRTGSVSSGSRSSSRTSRSSISTTGSTSSS